MIKVEYPKDDSSGDHGELTSKHYITYNFTLANFWSPYLVKYEKVQNNGSGIGNLFNLYLDELDEEWTRKISEFDYVIVSAGHWFALPAAFYINRERIGCHSCKLENVSDLTTFYGYQMAIRSTFEALNGMENYKGITYLRTFSPSHFENGTWDHGGHCHRTKPYKRNETTLEGDSLKYYIIQLEEFKKAKEEGEKRGLKHRLLDITRVMLLRPDGHPDTHGHWIHDQRILHNDCLHWCLPGPIDTWNDFLLHMIQMESKS
ncbi:hypothetical protein MLD38_000249 [Melastoma candidum]|uniref:Uncharacterized protein n=1 Tax=Melastoma candidum TaxID=119954 RepID=A0ACB9SAR9_9MYRT|nr:hypothetical protein MLD38_000249 [Melastoma candidum]